jgi:APA family basic amino acid/polyamine antiporter
MVFGLLIYGLYGRWHSRLANEDSWDYDTDHNTGGMPAVRMDDSGELKAIRTPQQQKPTRGKHMRN